jgi:hypothetical protein
MAVGDLAGVRAGVPGKGLPARSGEAAFTHARYLGQDRPSHLIRNVFEVAPLLKIARGARWRSSPTHYKNQVLESRPLQLARDNPHG